MPEENLFPRRKSTYLWEVHLPGGSLHEESPVEGSSSLMKDLPVQIAASGVGPDGSSAPENFGLKKFLPQEIVVKEIAPSGNICVRNFLPQENTALEESCFRSLVLRKFCFRELFHE